MVRSTPRSQDRRSNDVTSSVRQAEKKDGGGKFALGKAGDYSGGATVDARDPNYDPDERRVDPDDGTAYKYEELAAFYKSKFTAQQIAEYWEYECTAVKRRGRKAEAPAGPSLEESAAQAKADAEAKAKGKSFAKKLTQADLAGDGEGPLAREVAAILPYFPFKKLDKFYDVQGLLNHPNLLNAVCAVMAKRFRKLGVTKIAAFEASGFLFSPVAIKSGKPFIMLRQQGKMPNTVSSESFSKEKVCCLQQGAIVEGDKVAIIDDLITNGASQGSAIELIKSLKADVVECSCVVELTALKGRDKCLKAGALDVWSFISEELLTTKALLPEGYVDDGSEL